MYTHIYICQNLCLHRKRREHQIKVNENKIKIFLFLIDVTYRFAQSSDISQLYIQTSEMNDNCIMDELHALPI